jgi:glycosyltransferase involved in cell wall biosynthesis
MPNDAPLDVVIVHREQPERCVRTARSLLAQGVAVRLVVVDNGSSPGVLALLEHELPETEVIPLGANRGFGPAANVGLRRWLDRGAGEGVALAPHDALLEEGCLQQLLTVAGGRPRAGLASAVYGDPTKPVVDRYFGGILVSAERTAGWEQAGHPHGTLMLARRACLADVGLFDERYFAYCEEADLGERARRAGWEVGVVWGAVVRNPSLSVSTAVVEYLQLRNSLLLVRDHFGRYPAFIRLAMAIGTTVIGAVWPPRRTPIFSVPARCRAILDFGRGRFGPPPDALLAA